MADDERKVLILLEILALRCSQPASNECVVRAILIKGWIFVQVKRGGRCVLMRLNSNVWLGRSKFAKLGKTETQSLLQHNVRLCQQAVETTLQTPMSSLLL